MFEDLFKQDQSHWAVGLCQPPDGTLWLMGRASDVYTHCKGLGLSAGKCYWDAFLSIQWFTS